ncbi:MAG: DEAD/DEAH box helicase, partial [Anaerolineales bacterium]
MSAAAALEQLRLDPEFMANVVAWERIPARPARYGPLPEGLDGQLAAAVGARLDTGARQQSTDVGPAAPLLYTHQSAAIRAALAGENVAVVTGTASGKTLCYNLPVLNTLLAEPDARALYLFPTKALAQDQASELNNLIGCLATGSRTAAVSRRPSAVRIYDGDTPQGRRPAIRREARLLITNPDMLHTGILPHHTQWAEFFAHLRWVVLDEMHTYRGVFGSHVANVLRRLQRLCAFHGSRPQYICTSATIANPEELVSKLIGAPVTLVPPEADGSPQAAKHFLIYNPPLIDPYMGLRRAYTLEARDIAVRFLAHDVQTIVFARARVTTELLLGYIRDRGAAFQIPPAAVRGYRGGYLPEERRGIERGLRAGQVRGVVATNALELGIDIGQLGAAIIAGYPGSIASLWQQAGRAGRRSETSAVVFVASGAPLDQYLALQPRYVFESAPEHGLINPDNLAILVNHLRCALFELPFATGEGFGAFDDVSEILDVLAEMGEVHASADAARWIGSAYPAAGFSLRTAGNERIAIQTAPDGRPVVIGEVDAAMAPLQVHTGAIYVHEGSQYIVRSLDWENQLATVEPAQVDYYTRAAEATTLAVQDVFDADPGRPARRAHGQVLVTSQATGYRKIKHYTHEVLGFGEIDTPAREFETTAYWTWLGPKTVAALERDGIMLRPNNYGPNWQPQRAAARARDGFRCRQCGAPEVDGRHHDVHHIRPFRDFRYLPGENEAYLQANALDNLLTLCPRCHHRLETARGTRTALSGLAHALLNVAPLHLMCDPRDISSI